MDAEKAWMLQQGRGNNDSRARKKGRKKGKEIDISIPPPRVQVIVPPTFQPWLRLMSIS